MPKWVDYKILREKLDFEALLKSYNIELDVTKTDHGRQHKGPCPLSPCVDEDESPRSFSANLDKGIWQCFKCGAKGNQVEFGVIMQGYDPQNPKQFRHGALALAEQFGLTRINNAKKYRKPRESKRVKEGDESKVPELINEPLDFELKSLDGSHEWFDANGIKPETVEHFGLGYCGRGYFKGRIAVPIHNKESKLVAYAGLICDENTASDKNPLVLYPKPREREGKMYIFDNSQFLYNAHRLDGDCDLLTVTEDFKVLWLLWQEGVTDIVCCMNGMPSTAHHLAKDYLSPNGKAYWLSELTSL
jgi:hypothetical protein